MNSKLSKVESYTQTINTLRSSLNLDYELDRKILDILPKLIEARARYFKMSGLTMKSESGIIESEIRKKTNWVKGAKGLFAGSVPYGSKVRLAKGEYKKIVSEINTNYGKYEGEEYCIHPSVWIDKYYTYEFINYGFDDYEFKRKRRG